MSQPENIMEALAGEIERVTILRERYKRLSDMPNVNVVPVIALMTGEIDIAKKAIGLGDIRIVAHSLQNLRGFTE